MFGDFSATLQKPSGQLLVAVPLEDWRALRPFQKLVSLDQRLHSTGEGTEAEIYLLTIAQGIPIGSTGKVWKLVRQ